MLRIGLISDTHGLLRPEAIAFLRGCDHIVHGGDIGAAEVIEQLSGIAPVSAIRGNNDRAPWAASLRDTELVQIGTTHVYIVHDLTELDIDPAAAGVQAVISGHSHIPRIEERDAVLYVNPGSAGPRRFRLPIALGEIRIDGAKLIARTVALNDAGAWQTL
jgi:putative phosphoesterase